MTPTNFEGSTGVMDTPDGMTCDQVQPIFVRRGGGSVISCWKPNQGEMQEILRTGQVWVAVMGEHMFPICLMGYRPFEEE